MKTINNKIVNTWNLVAAIALFAFTGCKGAFDTTKPDGSSPYAGIVSPGSNSAYQASDPVKLRTEFADKDGFKQIDVEIVRMADGAKGSESVVKFQRTPGVGQYVIDTTFAANTFTPGKYQISIHSVDKRSNESTKDVTFNVN